VHLALIKYTVLRLGLFVVSLIVLWAVGVKSSIVLYAAAALISLILSYLLLGRPRNELATALADRVGNRVERRHAATLADDAEDQAAVQLSTADEAGPAEDTGPDAEPRRGGEVSPGGK
jgi:hypothetical protein